jgi:hypothetical protein
VVKLWMTKSVLDNGDGILGEERDVVLTAVSGNAGMILLRVIRMIPLGHPNSTLTLKTR